MSVEREWFDKLDPETRALVLEVIAIRDNPTDEQIAEAPDLIAKSWSLDAIGIPVDKRPALETAIGELAKQLRATRSTRSTRSKRR